MANVKAIATGVILTIVTIIVVFQLVGNTSNDITLASDNITASGLPLANLFASNGVVLLIFMVGVLLAIVGIAMKMGGGK